MIATLLLLLVGGIALAQAVSDPKQVTLRWLRLGGLTNIALLAVAATLAVQSGAGVADAFWMVVIAAVAQLLTVQLGMHVPQRVCAVATFVCVAIAAEAHDPITAALSAGVLGGFLMTMLLGHAYLTAGNEMTQAPFARLVKVMLALLVVRAVVSGVLGAWPYFDKPADDFGKPQTWNMMMIAARYGVGIVVPMVFTFMTLDCVKRMANQSATGILYVAGVLVILGEGAALVLFDATGFAF